MSVMYSIEYDWVNHRRYYIYHKSQPFLKAVAAGGPNNRIAKVGNDFTAQLADGLAILKNGNSLHHITDLVGVDKNYTLLFRTAEYHSYFGICSTEKCEYFGAAPTSKGAILGISYMRDDAYYDKKHFLGHKTFSLFDKQFDRASHSVEFPINKTEANNLIYYLNQKIHEWQNDAPFFHLFSLWNLLPFFENAKSYPWLIDGANCNDLALEVFAHSNISNGYYPFHYYRADELNLYDKGVLYNYAATYGINNIFHIAFEVLKHHLKPFLPMALQVEKNPFPEPIKSIWYNSLNGEEISLVEVNSEALNSLYGDGMYTVLMYSIRKKNIELFKALLADARVDLHQQNVYSDNAAQIAVDYQQFDMLYAIYEKDESALYNFNEYTQPPICFIVDCEHNMNYRKYWQDYATLMHTKELVEPF